MTPAVDLAIAFDVPSLAAALALDARLGSGPELAKIGLQLFAAEGPQAVHALRERGRRVFLDLKLHDIPNTVRGAARAAAASGAELLTVHAMGGEAMIRAAVEGAREGAQAGVHAGVHAGGGDVATRVVAVTLLTSLDPAELPPGFARPFDLHATLARLLDLTERAGASGIVCAATDLPGIRAHHPRPFLAVTPGIRPAGASADDQRRVTTVAEAVRLGAGVLVLGRAVTAAPEPRAALAAARAETGAVATA